MIVKFCEERDARGNFREQGGDKIVLGSENGRGSDNERKEEQMEDGGKGEEGKGKKKMIKNDK